jgi:hypothetical protein
MNPWDQSRRRGPTTPLRRLAHGLRVRLRDAAHNRRGRHYRRRILVLRHGRNNWNYNEHFLAWVATHAPAALERFELRRVPSPVAVHAGHCLLVPWLQDPLRERFPRLHAQTKALELACAQRGVATVNPPDALSNAVKTRAAEIIRSVGVRTPRMVPITDVTGFLDSLSGLRPPFIVRENDRHGGPMFLIEQPDALAHVPFARLSAPIGSEYVDTRGADGLYRRYRYVAIGDRGIPRSLRISTSWESRREMRVFNAATHAEEHAYLERPDPNHDALQRARRALGFDVVAFDYAYDTTGALVVFEPNPLPNLWDPTGDAEFQRTQHALFDVIYGTLLRYYLERAGLPAPSGTAAPHG